jgi:hypothetical protein
VARLLGLTSLLLAIMAAKDKSVNISLCFPKLLAQPISHERSFIHPIAWRDCPKRGTNNALSANLDVLGGKNGSKSAVLVLCKATGQAPLTLFGQSRKGNSANFACMGFSEVRRSS